MRLMAGKASLLLAAVLFGMGATGLILTAGETTHFGPFQPAVAPPQTLPNVERAPLFAQAVIILAPDGGLSIPVAVAERQPTPTRTAVLAASTAPPAATPTPLPPLIVGGIASDDGGVQAAAATPPPIRFIMVAGDGTDDPAATPTETPAPGPATAGEASATTTPEAAVPPVSGLPGTATPTPAGD